ncbi:hypothetical protein Tsubulata_043282 [Turnera subulata]|uniref:Uncharacterized protein n=1 Tax=Turnera subulata TaxID=218843 RepID=A0A9Q0JM19_9ROSI|nr:hypothetical protein Tsubulata_043282 [Turnera subulata]
MYQYNQQHRFLQGEYFARRGVMLMETHGRNVCQSAMKYATRILCSRTSSGVLTLIVLPELPLTLRNVSMPV